MIKITLKPNIDSLLETDEETQQKHTNFIGVTPVVSAALGKSVDAVYFSKADITSTPSADFTEEAIDSLKYLVESTLVFMLPTEELIHHSWVATINGQPILEAIDTSSAYIKVSKDYLLDTKTKAIVNKADIKICTECGNPLDTHSKILCSKCLVKKHYHVQNYSYKPTLVFHGTQTGTHAKANPTWYGLELEFGLETQLPMAHLISDYSTELFLKSDSSIQGGKYQAEMVSQPASFSHLMSADSWVNNLDTLDAVNKPESNGCHIHISRTAFKDNKHYAKFKFLIQEQTKLVELIGGRKLNQYCNIMANKNTMFKTMKEGTGGEKYALCNEQHKDTIELRFMASSNKPAQVRRYIQYLDAMVKYTAYYGSTATYEGYYKYVTKYKATYSDIYSLLAANESLLIGEVTYKEPVLVTEPLEDIPSKFYGAITQLQFFDVNGFTDGETRKIDSSRFNIEMDTNTGSIRNVMGWSIRPTSKVLATYAKI